MKIIGKTEKGYIAEFSEHELAKINGFRSCYDDDWRRLKGRQELKIGTILDVSKLANKVTRIKDNEAKVLNAITTFRHLADALEECWPSFKKIEEDSDDR